MNHSIRILAAALVAALFATIAVETSAAADPPAERVVVMYFHRTQRCPTCQKMGTYSEEATKAIKKDQAEGKVSFHYIDFQDTKNAAYTKAYNITGPALIVAKAKGGSVSEYKNLKDIWTKVREKDGFLNYVQENIKSYLK